MFFNKKFIAGTLVVMIMTSSLLLYFPKKAEALSLSGGICDIYSATIGKLFDKAKDTVKNKVKGTIGSIIGNKVPVIDESVEAAVNAAKNELSQTEQRIDCKTRVERVFLAVLKTRILDVMVDQTINWIGGGGSPKFVTNLGGFLEDVGQAAVGDVAQEIGLGDLCTGIDPVRLRAQLETPIFSQRVSCTLDDVVGNIERFADNFQSGGFIGYQELMKPQNNRWGLEIMASSEAERRQAEAQANSSQEISTGGGFLSTKKCLEWEARGTDNNGKSVSEIYDANNVAGGAYPDPSTPPPASIKVTGVNNLRWVCTEQRVTTPGQLLVGATDRAMGLQASYIINAETFEDYAAAIVDAALNRLIMAGVDGLVGLTADDGPSGGYYTRSNVPASITGAGEDFNEGSTGEILETSKENLTNQLNDASTALADLESDLVTASPLNNKIADTVSEFLAWCNASANKENHPQTCADITATAVDDVKGREATINQLLGKVQNQIAFLPQLSALISSASDEELQSVSQELTDFIQIVARLIEESDPFINLDSELAEFQSLLSDCQAAPPQDPTCP